MLIVNAEGSILGRLSTEVAKLLIKGEEVIVINADKAMIVGHKTSIINDYKRKLELKDKVNPEHSPYFSRRPDLIVKRSIKGMLPKHAMGRIAYKRLKVYIRGRIVSSKRKRGRVSIAIWGSAIVNRWLGR